MIVTDDIFVMLLTEDKFMTFSPNPICDTSKATEVLLCLSLDSRTAVDEMVEQALAAGASTYKEGKDLGFMYGNGFKDIDGHLWELIYMQPSDQS